MVCTKLHYVPIILFLWLPITFLTTYIIAIELGHVSPVFPYISDTGTFSPESCIFGQLLNMGALLMVFVMYIRYRQVKELTDQAELQQNIHKLNKAALYFGGAACLGISVVANFQETRILSVHLLGACMGFGLGAIYFSLQTSISFKVYPLIGDTRVLYFRLVMSFIDVVLFFATTLCSVLAYFQFTGDDMTKWNKDDGGWELHLAATVTEWIIALITALYILTFSPEFRTVQILQPPIVITEIPLNTRQNRVFSVQSEEHA